MQKKVFSVKSEGFEKSIRRFDDDRKKALYDEMKKLEDHENNPGTASTVKGKTLSAMKCNHIYALEIPNTDRILAVVIEKEDKKIFAWFWGGSHEDYNHKIDDVRALRHSERMEPVKVEPKIVEKIEEIKLEAKALVLQNIENMKKQYAGSNSHGKKNSNRLK